MFPEFFATFWKSAFSFKYCEKRDESQSLSISEVIDGEKSCYVIV